MKRPSLVSARALALALALALILVTSCAASPDDFPARVDVAPLDEAGYGTFVHPVIERACGSTDCHGKLPRGMRVYGERGLRLPDETGRTSAAEIRATYVSIVGLEPERLNTFLAAQPRSADAALELLVLAKPLALERHRGGISLRKGEPAEQCILSWLLTAPDPSACTR